jgi:serine/threonine protein kinase
MPVSGEAVYVAIQQPSRQASSDPTETLELLGPGSLLSQRYRIDREIGHGGFGSVYLARDEQLHNKPVVIKIRHEKTSSADAWREKKFREECKALARIDHPGVVGVLDQGQTPEGKLFLVMQYVDGMTLRQALKEGPLGFARVAELTSQIAEALGAAHDRGVCHRDLKPENVMLRKLPGDRELAVIIDFGIAGIRDPATQREDSVLIAGSLEYMAPEQLKGRPRVSSDIYGLGTITYEMLTGKRPFSAQTPVELFIQQKQGVQVKPVELRKDLPMAAQEAILRALSFDPKQRHSRAVDFGVELSKALTPPAEANGENHMGAVSKWAAKFNQVEIGFVLFMDLVRSSGKPIEQQVTLIRQLTQIVQDTASYQRARSQGALVCLPTGDAMALAFLEEPIAPVECALEISRALKDHPEIELRIGINMGPVSRVEDINEQKNIAGCGINLAQGVMECGDAGHILVSGSIADVLSHLSEWSPYLRDLGEHKVKGEKVHVFNLYKDSIGNASLPKKFRQTRRLLVEAFLGLAGLGAVVATINRIYGPTPPPPTPNRTLTYHVMVQSYRSGRPYREPFRISRETIVEAGDRIQFVMSSPQPGHLYLLNEGPARENEVPTFNTLFPSLSGNGGSSFVQANQELDFPATINLEFDKEEGSKKFWVLWSSQPLPQLEALKEWTMSGHDGSVQNTQQQIAIRDFLADRALATAVVDDADKHITIIQKADPLVYLIRFEHH